MEKQKKKSGRKWNVLKKPKVLRHEKKNWPSAGAPTGMSSEKKKECWTDRQGGKPAIKWTHKISNTQTRRRKKGGKILGDPLCCGWLKQLKCQKSGGSSGKFHLKGKSGEQVGKNKKKTGGDEPIAQREDGEGGREKCQLKR